MKKRSTLLLLVLVLHVYPLLAQSDIATAFASARQLNDKQEYLAATKAFQEVQNMATIEENIDYYLRSVVAEGECYYMLHLVSNLQQSMAHAQEVYDKYANSVAASTRLIWDEVVSKLRGSYHSCMVDANFYAFGEAERAYRHCLDLIETIGEDDGEMEVVIHRELLSLYYKHKNYEQALEEAKKVFNYFYWELGYVEVPKSPADERMNRAFIDAVISKAMVLGRLKRFDEAWKVFAELPKSCNSQPFVLRTKGKLLMMQYDYDGTDRRKEAMTFYSQYILQIKRQADGQLEQMTDIQREQYWLNLHDFLFDCYRLEDYAPEMLYDLALFSKGYLLEYHNRNRQEYTWKDVQRALDNQSCAIEFVQYNGKDDTKQLGALVLTKQSPQPMFLHIADVDSLKNYRLKNWARLSDALVFTSGTNKDAIYNDPDLPHRLWTKDLLDALEGATKVYFSADGMLQQLAIEYMMPDSARSCRRLTSTRRLVEQRKPLNQERMLLIGGVDYSTPASSHTYDNDEYAYLFLQPYADGLSYLPGSQREIDSIQKRRHSIYDLKIDGAEASDHVLQTFANHYPIVHVATHGYFCGIIEDGSQLQSILYDNSMSQSGLVFSGAKYALKDPDHDPLLSDGLLSAKEMAAIPLDSVELMVLSACQTGLGYITADGVYGVQRALKQAGVKALIVSLWSVNDAATSLLMMTFYDNLKNDENADVHEAFMKARHQLMETKMYIFDIGTMSMKFANVYAKPQYTNAFILIDVQ